ncbi:MAG TPA: M23 family metallopeptidase [Pseudothermotoga sp.]|uniref:LysM peptidoglycan-binding domain-containing protein n=1 Tax=Thermotoga profunda TaxID=1508420 RepID=UPI000597E425|nr:M23 family metallopeptidase [Thermotoga profunda]
MRVKKLFILFSLLVSVVIFGGYLTVTYVIQSGDNLYDIAKKFKVSASTILDWNNLSNPLKLKPGQQITIPQPEGFIYNVKQGDSLYTIARMFFTTVSDIMLANELSSDFIKPGQRLFIPQKSIGKAFNTEKGYIWPIYGVISSPYGWRVHPVNKQMSFHSGLDIAAPEGTPIFSSTSGVVSFAGEKSGYGLMVEVKSSNNTIRYGHLSKITVYVGQKVERGTLLGRVGSTGVSTGPHLHFEVLVNDSTVNPLALLPSSNKVYVLKEGIEAAGGE